MLVAILCSCLILVQLETNYDTQILYSYGFAFKER